MLKAQDIVILLKILAVGSENIELDLSQNKLAIYLCMSVSEVNAGIKRLMQAGLIGEVSIYRNLSLASKRKPRYVPIKTSCEECLISGVKYFFPGKFGSLARGIVTSYASPVFEKQIAFGNDPVPVWPYGEGDVRGVALEPLYSSVPNSIAQYPDQKFYELLTLIDAIRSGRARERNLAIKLLKKKINE